MSPLHRPDISKNEQYCELISNMRNQLNRNLKSCNPGIVLNSAFLLLHYDSHLKFRN